jgi:hypothetical protein
MRRGFATTIAVAAAAIAVAGCGSGSSSSGDPLGTALSYLPKSAPLAIVIDSNPNGDQWKAVGTILNKFSLAGRLSDQFKQSIKKQGLDFDKDLKPLLGNPGVVGAPDVQGLNGNGFVVALKVKDKGKAASLLKQSKDLTADGSANGATLYKQDDGGETGLDDDVLLSADSKAALTQAIQRHNGSDHLTPDQINTALDGLPGNALVKVYADVEGLLNQSAGTADARKIKWIAALRTLGLTGTAANDGVKIDFNLKTDSSGLTDADLPLASGDSSPGVVGKSGEFVFALRGPNQLIAFAENAAQAVSPGSFADFERAKAQIGRQLGIDVDKDVIDQLSGDTSIAVGLDGNYAVRAELKDPAAFSKTLVRLEKVAPSFAGGVGLKGARITKSHGLYKLSGSSGKPIYYGVLNKALLISTDPARIAQMASQQPASVPGAKGSFVTSSDAGAIVARFASALAGGGLGGALGGSFASAPIGNLDGWVNSSTSGLKGHLQLGIK